MIEVEQLNKVFGKVVAVKEVSFNADRGEIFGLLGPNGAGKTTTLRILYGLCKPSHGSVHVDKLNVVNQTQQVQHNCRTSSA